MRTCTAKKYVHFGMAAQVVWNCAAHKIDGVLNALNHVINGIESMGLPYTKKLLGPLKEQLEFLQKDAFENSEKYNGDFGGREAYVLSNRMTPIVNSLLAELEEMQTCVLNQSAVSDKLKTLPDRLNLTPTQSALLDETKRCLECEAYRAAMVMGWSLVYDYIRWWIWDNPPKLKDFNTVFVSKKNRKGQPYTAIVKYEDFYGLQESDVLRFACEAQLWGDKELRSLIEHLDRRNDFAHPSFKHPDSTQAIGYISGLLSLIEHSPFK
jgi:hypothetical protein